MEYLNKVELKGVVGRANVTNYGDMNVTTFSVVTEYAYENKSGVSTLEMTWFSCTAYKALDIAKGDRVHVEGRFRTRKYLDQENVERVSYDVVVNKVEKI